MKTLLILSFFAFVTEAYSATKKPCDKFIGQYICQLKTMGDTKVTTKEMSYFKVDSTFRSDMYTVTSTDEIGRFDSDVVLPISCLKSSTNEYYLAVSKLFQDGKVTVLGNQKIRANKTGFTHEMKLPWGSIYKSYCRKY